MNVQAQLNYSHGYFVKFLHWCTPVGNPPSLNLFVFVIHTRQQVKYEIKTTLRNRHTATGYSYNRLINIMSRG